MLVPLESRAQSNASTIVVPGGGFETPLSGNAYLYGYQLSGSQWMWDGYAGVQRNGSGLGPAAPQGSQTAFVKAGTSFSQGIYLEAGTYRVNFQVAQNATQYPVPVQFKVDGAAVGAPIYGVGGAFTGVSVPFKVSASGFHNLRFDGVVEGFSFTALIDDVVVERVQDARNGSFETPLSGNAYLYGHQLSGTEWTWNGNAGVQRNGSGFGPAAPEGAQTAFMMPGSSFSQNVTLAAGTYRISFAFAQNATQYPVPVQLKLDNTAIGAPITGNSSAFTPYASAPITVGAGGGTYRLSFNAVPTGGTSFLALIDNVAIEPVPQLGNGSFEAPVYSNSSYGYQPANSGWAWSGMAGIAHNGSLGANAPEGVQTAFLQGGSNAGAFSQSVALSAGNYQVKFKAAQRATGNAVPIEVSFDGNAVGAAVTPGSTAFAAYSTASFAATQGNHLLRFSTSSNSGISMSLIDDVRVELVGSPTVTLPAPIAPSAPTGLSANAVGTQATLNWSAVPNATGYRVKRATALNGPYSAVAGTASGPTFTDGGLAYGTTYFYRVYAFNAGNSGADSNAVSVTPIAAPLATTRGGNNQISVDWGAVAGATSYTVTASTSATASPFYTTTVSGLTATHFNLSGGTTYFYRVVASNATATSTSNPVSGLTLPAAPNPVTPSPGDTRVKLNWNAVASATSYSVRRAPGANGPWATLFPSVSSPGFTDSGLDNGVTYYYRVYATNASGNGLESSVVSATTIAAPAAPTGFYASSFNALVKLRWNAVPGATSYNIKRSTSANDGYQLLTTYRYSTDFDDRNVVNGTTYYYRVSGVNASGEGAESAPASATPVAPPSGVPTNLSATGGDAQVTLNWSAVPGATSYRIRISSVPNPDFFHYSEQNTVGAETSKTVSPLQNGTLYYFSVYAVNNGGNGPLSAQVSATPRALPAAPSLSAFAGDAKATLSWSNVSGAASYRVKRRIGAGGAYTTLPDVVTAVPFIDGDLTNGTTYYYRVYAVNSTGPSPDSNEVAVTPTAADNFIRQGGFETPNLPAASYRYTDLAGSEWTFDHGSGIASQGSAFGIATAPEGVQVAFVQATGSLRQTVTFGAGTYALRFRAAARDGLPHNYAIKIDGVTIDTLAQNNHPSSGYQQVTSSAFTVAAGAHEIRFVGLANIDRTVLLDDVQTVTATPTVPTAPTGLQAVAGNARVDLTWTAVAGATSYEVYASTDPNALVSVATVNALTFPHEQLTNGTIYYYRVLARNASGNSPLSNQVSATPIGKPLNLTATASDAQVVLKWNAVSGATGYKIKRSETDGGPYTTLNTEEAGTSYTDGNLTNGTPYYSAPK